MPDALSLYNVQPKKKNSKRKTPKVDKAYTVYFAFPGLPLNHDTGNVLQSCILTNPDRRLSDRSDFNLTLLLSRLRSC